MGIYNEMYEKFYCRGESTDNHEWVFGWIIPLFTDSEEIFIITNTIGKNLFFNKGNVIPQNHIRSVVQNTVCRYIGKKDCYGRMIFEDDIVRTNRGRLCRVKWFSSPSFIGWDLDPVETKNPQPREERLWKDMIVIGNIHDNPELLRIYN